MNDLSTLPLFDGVPDHETGWLLAHGYEEEVAPGEFFIREDELPVRYYIVLEGELQVTRTNNGKEVVLGTTPRGIMGGELSLLNGSPSNVSARAILPSRLLVLDAPAFRESFATCPIFSARVFQIAAERLQGYASYLKQQEKMAALGKLSAGLAHELNNPAAAARRAAKTLRDTLPALQSRAVTLNTLGLSQSHLEDLVTCQQQAASQVSNLPLLSALERSDREESLGDWLDAHNIPDG